MKSTIIIIPILFVSLNIYSQTYKKLYPISDGNKYGLINRNKDTITGYIYNFISSFKNGYAIIQKENKYGMINYKGVETINPIYDKIEYLYNGLTVVTLNDSCTIVDSLGNYFTNQWYYQVDTPLTNIFRVVKKINYGAGILIRNTIRHYNLEDKIGLLRDSVLFSNMLIGYISRNSSALDGIWFSGGEKFVNGQAKVSISRHTYFLDVNGKITPRIADDCDLSLMNIFIPDEFPQYPGGKEAINNFLDKNFKYPENTDVMYHNAEVIVSFIVDKSGYVVSPMIVKSVDPLIDAEVLSVINKFKRWEPAKYDGVAVCYKIEFPFRFTVQNIGR